MFVLEWPHTSINDESGNQEQCHSILQILLRCNESLRATCFLLPPKQGPSSSIFRAAASKGCLKAHLFLDFFFSGVQSGEPAFSSHGERACARAGVVGCRQHAVRTMNSKPQTNTAAIERKHTVRQGCGVRTHAITDVEWVQWHLTPASQTPVNTIHPRCSVHDSAIICFPPSDLHAVMSRHYFLLLHC